MKKITLSLFLLLGTFLTGNVSAQCVANGTMTSTGTPGEFTITDLSSVPSTGYSYFSAGDGGTLFLQPSTTTGTYQYTANGTYVYYFAVMDSSTVFCADTMMGTITITGITPPPPACQAAFSVFQDTVNPGIYWCWNNSTGGSPSTGLSYLWDFGDGTTSTLAYPSHVYNGLGLYIICLTVSVPGTTCTDTYCDSILVTVKASGTTLNVLPPGASASVEELSLFSGITTYPNPTSGYFAIELTAKTESATQFEVVNLAGQVLSSSTQNLMAGKNKVDFDASSLTEGVYLVRMTEIESGVSKIIRFVKK